MPVHTFIGLDGTLRELGPGARIEFNGQDGTRQEIVLVGRTHLDELLADVQSAKEDVNGVAQNALTASRKETRTLFGELSLALSASVGATMDAVQKSVTADMRTTKFAFRIEMDSRDMIFRLRAGGLSDLIFAIHQSVERKLHRIRVYLYVLSGLTITSLVIGLISLFSR